MDPVINYEKQLYFPTKKDYLVGWITHEDYYLIWKYLYFLRREEGASGKLSRYYWRRRKNDLGARLGILIYAGCCGKGLRQQTCSLSNSTGRWLSCSPLNM